MAIDLYKFGGFATQEGVDVFWATSEESNNMFFDVQKSSNGINFETIGKVYGSGNSKKTNNYSFVDKNAVGINYYRLKYVEIDGTVGYSKKIKVSTDGVSSNLTLNPSFVSVGNVLVNNLTDAEQTIKTIKVYNSIGQIVPVPFSVKNFNSISFDSSNLLSGNYFVKILQNGKLVTRKITKY
ncbi:MAG: T9SS type A sorting domain-containing protein [Pseudarcicella sp.]|nr:T9SS type A sorting domain-containing protein [Pseudarcicella sp.]